MNNLQKRILSALFLGTLLILAIWWNRISLFIVMLLILSVSMYELCKLSNRKIIGLFVVIGLFIYLGTYWLASITIIQNIISWIIIISALNTLFVINFFMVDKPVGNLIPVVFYICLSMCCLHFFQFNEGSHSEGLLMILALIWASDIGAYFIGKKYGKRKLIPTISPNKTIEGFWGGMGLNFILCVLMILILKVNIAVIGLGIIVHLFSVVGDLFESKIKRYARVKDSGGIIPGHGGMLDRFDGFFFALPPSIVFYYFSLS